MKNLIYDLIKNLNTIILTFDLCRLFAHYDHKLYKSLRIASTKLFNTCIILCADLGLFYEFLNQILRSWCDEEKMVKGSLVNDMKIAL